jgi:exodeoxyribonuclease VII large subunit
MASRPDKPGPPPQLPLDALFGAPDREAAPPAPHVHTVSELVRLASRALEQKFRSVWVEGEVEGLKRPASGHVYFSLKDGEAVLPAVMWRAEAARLRFALENGLAVRCRGTLRIYEAQGRFQLYVEQAEPAGLGALMLALEQLKRRLAAEGLFDAGRKRPLPLLPRAVGVVTSRTGAVLQDILNVSHRRFPVRLVLSPTAVQGSDAPAQIVAALRRLEAVPEIDVVIVARGGGSAEDLLGFSDERVVRAVAAAPWPVVSAVGHETDVSLCDHAADLRAPTPSAAAELVVPDGAVLERTLATWQQRALAATRQALSGARAALVRQERRAVDLRPRLVDARATLDDLLGRLAAVTRDALRRRGRALGELKQRVAAGHPRVVITRRRASLAAARTALAGLGRTLVKERRARLERGATALASRGAAVPRPPRSRLAVLAGRLQALSPLQVLGRGYAVALDGQGRALRRFEQVAVGEAIGVRLAEGRLGCTVVSAEPDP